MKKQFKFLSVLFLATALFSCEGDDEAAIATEEVGAYAYLADRDISIFDISETLTIDLFSNNGVQVESVEVVTEEGSPITTATVSGEAATFSTSTLGDLEAILNSEDEGSIPVRIVSQLSNGKELNAPATISVHDAIEFDEDNPTNVKFMDSTSSLLVYSTFTHAATIDNVSLFWKKNEDGTYVNSGLVLDVDEDEIDLSDIDYDAFGGIQVNDILFYKFVANSGALSQEIVAEIEILPQSFGAATNATLSPDAGMDEYDLGSGSYAIAGETGEMSFMDPSGFELAVKFVKVTDFGGMTAEEYFNDTDLFMAEAAYNDVPEVAKLTSVPTVSKDDVFIYKVTRTITDEDDVDADFVFYGIIKIDNTVVTNGTENSFEFKYAEGTIVRE